MRKKRREEDFLKVDPESESVKKLGIKPTTLFALIDLMESHFKMCSRYQELEKENTKLKEEIYQLKSALDKS
jgi:hypothetical protein